MQRFTQLLLLAALSPLVAGAAGAQDTTVTLAELRDRALRASPDVAAARAAADVARGQERQAGAFTNPLLSFSREQTGGAQGTAQDIIAADQTLDWPGVRSARRDAARARRAAAEARLADVEARVAFDAVRAYALALAADRRAHLADTVAAAFATAASVSERRLREGDISGFAARRIRLEAARYAALGAESRMEQRAARIALASLVADTDGAPGLGAAAGILAPFPALGAPAPRPDTLVQLALDSRRELAAALLETEAARFDARRAARERVPFVTLTAGSKSEDNPAGGRLSGFVAGVALPLPLWDRNAGAIAAASAEARRRDAELVAARRRVAREVLEAAEGLIAAQRRMELLGPVTQSDAAAALRSAQTAYAEGEISLLEWLDTVRAYQETEASIANLRADLLVRAAALERAVGAPLFQELR